MPPFEHPERTKTLGDERFVTCMIEELRRAREKFPNTANKTLAAMEEAGEAAKAVHDYYHGGTDTANIWKECVQAAAMFLRVAVEGDDSAEWRGYCFEDFQKYLKQ